MLSQTCQKKAHRVNHTSLGEVNLCDVLEIAIADLANKEKDHS